ncbi:hypothetical protein [Streptosporangium sp. CA-115845]|uniref:hypothetical protein n=1 Tax=Streptosporangium sp. CA-115845 TaxID=3240071 RepID=UPI003D9376DA
MADLETAGPGLFPWDELAGSCRDDPRIRFYVDRKSPHDMAAQQLVDWAQVLTSSSRDRAFRDSTALDSYAEFAELANAATRAKADFEELTAGFSLAAVRRFMSTRTTVLLVAALSLLVTSWADLVLLACQVVAIAVVPSAGLSLRAARTTGSLPKHLFAASCFVTGLALLAVPPMFGLPFSFASVLLMGAFLGLAWILSLDHTGRPLRMTMKMYLLLPAAPGLESRAGRARRRWLEDACENAVMPELIQTINRLLQPQLDKRLLVQDTTRLRAIYHAGLLVPTRAIHRAQEALRRSDGASIAVSGLRGSGKTTLLRRLCAGESQFSVLVSAPTQYVPKEFLIELFQRLCAAYIADQGFTVERPTMLKRRKNLFRYLSGATGPIVRMMLACLFTGVLIWTLTTELSHMAAIAAASVDEGLRELREWFASWWAGHRLFVQISLLFLIFAAVPKRNWRRLSWPSEPELVTEARRHYQRLQAEQTATVQAGGALPVLQAGFNRSVATKALPWTMPELVGHLCRFLEAVTKAEQARGRRVLICIDEVDRIGTAEEATRFLSEIKAVFASVPCHFLIAVADELGAALARRVITGHSHIENAFDEIVSLEPMPFELSRQLLQRRVPGFTDSFVWLGVALSGGLPRELIRVARRLVEINIEHEYELWLSEIADRLIREEVQGAITGTRGLIARLSASAEWGAVLDRLRLLARFFEPDAGLAELLPALKELADLSSEQPSMSAPDESPIKMAIAELSAFAFLGMTICDAFKDRCFDSAGTRDPAPDSTGPYVELAAARRELGVSAESCRAAVRRIRLGLNLP